MPASRAQYREDPILGTEKLCHECGEWWPNDNEFFRWLRFAQLFSAVCRDCENERKRKSRARQKAATT